MHIIAKPSEEFPSLFYLLVDETQVSMKLRHLFLQNFSNKYFYFNHFDNVYLRHGIFFLDWLGHGHPCFGQQKFQEVAWKLGRDTGFSESIHYCFVKLFLNTKTTCIFFILLVLFWSCSSKGQLVTTKISSTEKHFIQATMSYNYLHNIFNRYLHFWLYKASYQSLKIMSHDTGSW